MSSQSRKRLSKQLSTKQPTAGMPNKISDKELKSLECHFNWNIIESRKAGGYFKERIQTLEKDISNELGKNFPQLYSTLGYFVFQSDTENNSKKPEESFTKALEALEKNNGPRNLGYKAVVVGDLVHFYNSTDDYENAELFHGKYKKIEEQYPQGLSKHPEVLAMKAFVYSHSWKYEEAMEAYEVALQDPDYRDTADWIFGLAFAKTNHLIGRDMHKYGDEIECLLRRVIQIDPQYHLAKLRLARQLWESNKIHGIEEVEFLLEQVTEYAEKNSNVFLIEKAANTMYQYLHDCRRGDCKKYKRALKLFKQSEELNPDSTETLRGFGKCYFDSSKILNRKKGKKSEEEEEEMKNNLMLAEKYYVKVVTKTDRYYDKTMLAAIYHSKYLLDEKENFKYKEKTEQLYDEVLKKSNDENLKGKIEIYSRCVNYQKGLKNHKKEIIYLKELVDIVSTGAKEELYGVVSYAQAAQKRLMELASSYKYNKLMNEVDALELKSWILEKQLHFDSAIFYMERAIEKDEEINKNAKRQEIIKNAKGTELEEKLATLCLIKSQRDPVSYIKHTYEEDFQDAWDKITDLPKSSETKWKLYYEATKIEVNDLMGDHKRLEGLKKDRMEFEEFEKSRNMKPDEEDGSTDRIRILKGIVVKSKRLLDDSMNFVKEEVCGKDPKEPPFCYYPSPKRLKGGDQEGDDGSILEGMSISDRMNKYLDSRFEVDFSKKLPRWFDFLVAKQPSDLNMKEKYDWLQDFIDLRNTIEHSGHNEKQMFEEKFPTCEQQADLARDASNYAAEVWIFTEKEVDEYNKNKRGAGAESKAESESGSESDIEFG